MPHPHMSNYLPLGIRHILEQTGWTPHEIGVYSVLLEKGAMSLSTISLEANIGVSSTQYTLKGLHEKKMVKKFLMNSKPRWKACDIDALRKWVKGYAQQFEKNEDAVQHFIDQYDFNPTGNTASVEYFEGSKAVQKSLLKIGKRCKSGEILVVMSFAAGADTDQIGFLMQEYDTLRENHSVRAKVLVCGNNAKINANGLHEIRTIRSNNFFRRQSANEDSVIHIADDAVCTIHFAEGGPYSFIMEHPPMAAMLRGMFLCLWDGEDGG